MSPDLSPDEVRRRSFDTALRGYDKTMVDAFRTEVATELSRLHERIAVLEAQAQQLGISDAGDLAVELRKVGEDVASILDEARRSATELRERAASDAGRWRSEAEAESTALRTSAQTEAEQIRSDAWNQSSQMLEQVTQDVEEQIAAAKQDALFIRAEAERESLHMTAGARREADDVLRTAKTETERMTTNAQAEAARTLDEARRAAEGAQERARALEERRSELLLELDAARMSIGQLEKQIDERREVLEESAPSAAAAETGEWDQQSTHWSEDEGSVRVVPPLHLREPTPVDADELVEEVERLREGVQAADVVEPELEQTEAREHEPERDEAPEMPAAVPGETTDAPPETEQDDGEVEAGLEEDVVQAGGDDTGDGEGDVHEDDVAASASATGEAAVVRNKGEAEIAPADDAPARDASARDADETAPAASVAGSDEADDDADDGLLDDLFQRLRSDDAAPPPTEDVDRTEQQPPPPPAEPEPATIDQPVEDESALAEVPATVHAAGSLTAAEAVELRDRMLLPIENRALRSVKRRIVDLQNRALEELRVGDGAWAPDRTMFAADLAPDLGKLAQEAFVAGHRAAAEMAGATSASPPSTRSRTDAVAMVVEPLAAALEQAYERTIEQESGTRQVAAAVSRVFRAWRTDEAERRLRMAGYTAYHEGIIDGLAAMNVGAAVVVAAGAHAAQCPAVTGAPFDPAAASALRLPPAHEECASTIVLAG